MLIIKVNTKRNSYQGELEVCSQPTSLHFSDPGWKCEEEHPQHHFQPTMPKQKMSTPYPSSPLYQHSYNREDAMNAFLACDQVLVFLFIQVCPPFLLLALQKDKDVHGGCVSNFLSAEILVFWCLSENQRLRHCQTGMETLNKNSPCVETENSSEINDVSRVQWPLRHSARTPAAIADDNKSANPTGDDHQPT